MKEFKRHIAFLLIICFSFPQIATSMHYVLTEHAISLRTFQYIKPTKEIEHNCTYQLSSLVYGIANINYPNQHTALDNLGEQNYCSLKNYVFELAFNYRLRGPPNNITN